MDKMDQLQKVLKKVENNPCRLVNDRVHPRTNNECPHNPYGHSLRFCKGFRFDYYYCVHCDYKLESKS